MAGSHAMAVSTPLVITARKLVAPLLLPWVHDHMIKRVGYGRVCPVLGARGQVSLAAQACGTAPSDLKGAARR